jgi:hypothetical protein
MCARLHRLLLPLAVATLILVDAALICGVRP